MATTTTGQHASRRPLTIPELAAIARMYRADGTDWEKAGGNKSLNHWLGIAHGTRNEAKSLAKDGRAFEAYVQYLRSAALILEHIPTHPEYERLLTPKQKSNLALNGQHIRDALSLLNSTLREADDRWMQEHRGGRDIIHIAAASSSNGSDSSVQGSPSTPRPPSRYSFPGLLSDPPSPAGPSTDWLRLTPTNAPSRLSSSTFDIIASGHSKTVKIDMANGVPRSRRKSSADDNDTIPSALFIDSVRMIDADTPVAGGSFADVFRGVYQGRDVAVKRFRVFSSTDGRNKLYKRFYRELSMWQALKHPNILALLGVDRDALRAKGTLSMVSPWMMQGTLMAYLGRISGPAVGQHKLFIKDVSSGLRYLHAQRLAHGDLHGSNVLIDHHGRALLGDFGLTTVADMSPAPTTTINKAGAIRWSSPELVHIDGDVSPPRKTLEGDVFSFGRICLVIYTRCVPFHTIQSDVGVIMKVLGHQHPPRPTELECHGDRMPADLWLLICRCWAADPSARPDIDDAVRQMQTIDFGG